MKTYQRVGIWILLLVPVIVWGQPKEMIFSALPESAFSTKEGHIQSTESGALWVLQAKEGTLNIQLPETEDPVSWWPAYENIHLHYNLQAASEVEGTLRVRGRRAHLSFPLTLVPGDKGNTTLSLNELPLVGSPNSPKRLSLELAGNEEYSIRLTKISFQERRGTASPLRDRFGQRLQTNWEGKVTSETELKEIAEREWKELENMSPIPGRNKYGGWTGGPRFQASGFFRVEKGEVDEEGRRSWTMVDPEGYPFWSFGVTGLRHKYPQTDVTLWKGREAYFETLPPISGPYAEAYEEEDYVSFYTWNILRKWGGLKKWRDVSFSRLRKWGMNSLGNWAHESVLADSPLPYTRAIQSNKGNAPRLGTSRVPDVFDPLWEKHLDSLLTQTQQWKSDPLLIGYFVDNEMGWGHQRLLSKAGDTDVLRQYWREKLEKRYRRLTKLNTAWGSSFKSWEEVALMREGTDFSETFKNDYQELESTFADRYFKIISETLKKHDPNHMYLGARFTRKIKPRHVVEAAGKYCDVLSVNVYSYQPLKEEMDKWHKWSGGLPMLIGEHHVTLDSDRQLPPNYQVFNEEERYTYFYNFVHVWAHTPYAVGSHWYQYKDQPLTGRGSNGEQRIVGLVDITDQPHNELIQAVRDLAHHLYQWKMDGFKQ